MSKKANKSAAVRQQRAKKEQVADTPEQKLHRLLNYFPTPPFASRAGAELVLDMDPTARIVWEPACGQGHMAEPLKEYFPVVIASDIHAHGYGDVHDFLMDDGYCQDVPDWIVSNPPFNRAEAFIRQGLRRARRGVAMLLRVAFLEGIGRYSMLYEGPERLTVCAVFSERVSMVLGQWDPDAGMASCMAWFIFDKTAPPGDPIIRAIPPGTEARLTRHDDVRRFAKPTPVPLLEGLV